MSDIPTGALDAGESKAVSLLARVILPRPGEPHDVRKLYIVEPPSNQRRAHAPTRTSLEIGAESEVSFATYFNAFPASYWRRWSTVSTVVLRVERSGRARYRLLESVREFGAGWLAMLGEEAAIRHRYQEYRRRPAEPD